MEKTWVKRFVVGALFYFTLAGFGNLLRAQSTVLPFRLVHTSIIIVSLRANGEGPFDFVLDTGTDTTLVDPQLARQLSLLSVGQIRLNSLAGSQTVTSSVLQKLTAGPAQVQNLHVLIQDLSAARKIDPAISGIVGQNFLSHFNYLLDYQQQFIQFELAAEIRAAMDGDSVPMQTAGNRMIVASEVKSPQCATLRLTLDSGASAVMLVGRPAQVVDLRENRAGFGTRGGFRTLVGRLNLLTVGSQQFQDVQVLLPNEPSQWEKIEDGVLPTVLFRALYVNNEQGFVVFNPRRRKTVPQ
jgi:hypothetical protein